MVVRIVGDNDKCRNNIQSYLDMHGHKYIKRSDNNFILEINAEDSAIKLFRSLHKAVGTDFVPLFNEEIFTWRFLINCINDKY